MAGYKVYFKESVEKDLRVIPKKDLRKILDRIRCLGVQPRPPGCEKLTGTERYRVRQGNYRIVNSVQANDLIVWIVRVAHRKDVYR